MFGSLGALILLAVVGFLLYANIGVMAADPDDLAAVRADPSISLTDAGGAWVMAPTAGAGDTGLVFIPGAKVDPLAYAATLAGVVDDGVTVVITKPTLNLAFFDLRPLSAFTDLVPGIDAWSVGGHSLGGVKACQLAEDADGLVLFGSYCANDLSGTELPALSISGSQDGLSTPQKIDDAKHLLPADAEFVVIEGGNHAGFGAYGPQAGDGEATIPDTEIRAQITDVLGPFLLETVPQSQ
ncbi:Alpha/beta hydrolase family protein [Microbacterium pygmaeum]|uniref:Alpha/beta hydrolase family protein n=1 Tax=Microbacterium pygmaeum TaxID=370764 RepID=A0A1G8CY33_9MICO|nr:Alpha/beta hydrolase family protein [Microbacterium pygmaeum]